MKRVFLIVSLLAGLGGAFSALSGGPAGGGGGCSGGPRGGCLVPPSVEINN